MMSGFNPSSWSVSHRQLVLYLILAIAVAGGLSYVKLGRAEDPTFTIKVMVFSARWPGATAGQMQDQVAERIEKKLQELPHVDRVETYSRPGFCAVQLKLRDDTPPAEVADLWYQARKKISDIKPTLPEGVLGPQADDEYGDVYSGVYYFTGDGMTRPTSSVWRRTPDTGSCGSRACRRWCSSATARRRCSSSSRTPSSPHSA